MVSTPYCAILYSSIFVCGWDHLGISHSFSCMHYLFLLFILYLCVVVLLSNNISDIEKEREREKHTKIGELVSCSRPVYILYEPWLQVHSAHIQPSVSVIRCLWVEIQ